MYLEYLRGINHTEVLSILDLYESNSIDYFELIDRLEPYVKNGIVFTEQQVNKSNRIDELLKGN